MAISKDKKTSLVADLTDLLGSAKTTVFAKYQGLSVADLQALRALAREQGVTIKIVKNRLVKVALGEIAVYKDTDTTNLTGQLLYATSSTDEVAPAKILAKFAKDHQMLEIAGGFSGEGKNMTPDDIKSLSMLPSKEELIGSVVTMLLSPVTDTVSGLSGNLHAILDGVADKATN